MSLTSQQNYTNNFECNSVHSRWNGYTVTYQSQPSEKIKSILLGTVKGGAGAKANLDGSSEAQVKVEITNKDNNGNTYGVEAKGKVVQDPRGNVKRQGEVNLVFEAEF